MNMHKPLHILALLALFGGLLPIPATAATTSSATASSATETAAGDAFQGPYVSAPVTPKLSRPVRDLPVATPGAPGGDINPRRNPQPDQPAANISGVVDPLAGAGLNDTRTPDPLLDFEGVGNVFSVAPPDTNGDVGPNHYVQMVNIQFGIFDKSGNLLSGPTPFNELFNGFGGNCENDNAGDPVVLYDSMADRWLMAQFAGSQSMCVAISQTPDPTGAFYLYEFLVGQFPDYFKFGVWPDGYYMSANESSYTAYAFDRAKMLNGQPATFQKFTGGTNFLMPSDLDGATPPPAGAPNYFYTFKDDSYHGGADRVEVYAFHVDWVTPGNSTFTLDANLPISSYTYTVCGFFNFDCVPQGGTAQKVDAVSEWPMFHFPYRNFGAHETLVGNFAIDVGSDKAGIRWFELRKSGADWSLYQEGTYDPDANHHFMGSIAMDGDGNIALGYSVSSSSMFPAIRYTTRLASDPPGTFGSEAVLIDGSGSQTGTNRWGDYSSMSIDPVDDCTFWYTNEYYPVSSPRGWHTRVGAFLIPGCGGPSADLSVTKSASPDPLVAPGAALTYTLTITNSGPLGIITDTATLTDNLPSGLSVTDTNVPANWSCSLVGQAFVCTTSDLPVGATDVIQIIAMAPDASGTITNTVEVTSTLEDPNLVNNTAQAVTLVDTSPTAVDDSYNTDEDTVLMVAAPGLLENDSDADGDLLAIVDVTFPGGGSQPVHGELVWDNDGAFTYTPDLNYNGPEVFTYTVSDGVLTDTAAVLITVDPINDDPLVDAGADQSSLEGEMLAFSGSFTDPGKRSAILAGESFAWDFGDGDILTGTLTPTHTFADNGSFTVTLTVTDSQGGVGSDWLLVTVSNVAPELAPLADREVVAGELFTVTGVLTDPGTLDTQTVVIEWQPGVTETLNLPAGASSFDLSHLYAIPGIYTVTVSITDKDGGMTERSLVVIVNPAVEFIFLPLVSK